MDDPHVKPQNAEPTPVRPALRQEEIVKPVGKKAEQKPKRAQPKITFTSSDDSDDEFAAAALLVKKKEAEKKRLRLQKKEAKRRKSVSKVISSPLSAPEDEDEQEEDDEEPEKLDAILPTPVRQPVIVTDISPPAADYESSELSDLTDLSDLEDEVGIPPLAPPAMQLEQAPEPTSKRVLDELEPQEEQAAQRASKKARLAESEPSPLFDDALFSRVQVEEEFVLPLEIRERSTSAEKAPLPEVPESEVQEEAPEDEEDEDNMAEVAPAKNNRKKGKAGRRKAASKTKKKKKAAPAAPTRSRTTSRALSATPGVQALGLAEDDEDAYYLRLQLERVRAGKPSFPDEIPEEPEAPEGYQRPAPRHDTGCARAEGYYRVPQAEKLSYLAARNQAQVDTSQGTSSIAISRLARVNARHLVSGLDKTKKATASDADVLQFNQLRTRKKQLRFARSPIHDWGLYAQEYIPAGEMVIEYVGEQIRQQIADKREKQYERQGIGSSYLL